MNNQDENPERDREPRPDPSDDSSAEGEMLKHIHYQQVLRKLPRAIFAHLTEYEETLLCLIIAGDSTAAEVAEQLDMPVDKIARDVNRLRAKLRARTKSVLKGTALEYTFS